MSDLRNRLFLLMKNYVYRYSNEQFTLASGKKSYHYFNCKEVLLYPERLTLLAEYLANSHIPKNIGEVESVGGLTMGADPISYSLSIEFYKLGKVVYPLVVRKESKDHGTRKQIEGYVSGVKSCLVVDDVITTGGSTLKAVDALRKAGITVDKGICILDREEGGYQRLKDEGVTMFPIFKKSEFFEKDAKTDIIEET
ncbi:MAG: orotate phosphoribosyltransferase [Leptospiraceae bacterium]|nr:orotate phosphoribosyltransferase [Leptospiraceae bacterium]